MSDLPSPEVLVAVQQRVASLELLDELMSAVTGVLDVREVFDRIFEIGQRSLPHHAMSISVPIEGQLRASVNFFSATLARFTPADLPVARRIAAHITLTLSHQRLAEEIRRNDELRARAMNLELLDELLKAIIDSGELPDVFGRICERASKVLPHDAAALMVRLPDGVHARVYARSGVPGHRSFRRFLRSSCGRIGITRSSTISRA